MSNTFSAFVHKETLHIIRDVRTLLLVIGIPIVQLLLFGFAISDEIRNINFGVSAPHRTEQITQKIEKLQQNQYFTFKGYISEPEIDDVLRKGTCDIVAQFDDKGNVHLCCDASNPNTAQSASAYLQQTLGGNMSTTSLIQTRMLYNPQLKSSYNFVPGIVGVIFLLICALMTSVSIVREKETGTMEVLLVSPIKPIYIVIAKMIPYLACCCIDLVLILFMAQEVLGVPVTNSLWSIVGLSIIYIVLGLGLGLLISTLTDSQVTAMLVAAIIFLFPTVFLSGMVFPVENMPEILQYISVIVPARWFIDGIRKLMIQGQSITDIWQDVVILSGMAVAIIGIALKNFKIRLA